MGKSNHCNKVKVGSSAMDSHPRLFSSSWESVKTRVVLSLIDHGSVVREGLASLIKCQMRNKIQDSAKILQEN